MEQSNCIMDLLERVVGKSPVLLIGRKVCHEAQIFSSNAMLTTPCLATQSLTLSSCRPWHALDKRRLSSQAPVAQKINSLGLFRLERECETLQLPVLVALGGLV